MAAVQHHKVVSALPGTLEANSVYYVRVGQGYDQFVTNDQGTVVAYPQNAQSVYAYATLRAAAGCTYEDALSSTTSVTTSGNPTSVNTTSNTKVELGTAAHIGTGFTATDSDNEITVAEAGTYRITVCLPVWATSARVSVHCMAAKNGTKLDGVGVSGYIRDASAHNVGGATLSIVEDLAAADRITMLSRREAAAGTAYTVIGDTFLTVERLA